MMKKYLRPEITEIEIKVKDIIAKSGIYQSPDKQKSAIGADITDGTFIGDVDPNSIFN